MSIIRFSCVENELFAPRRDGKFVSSPYDAGSMTGRLGIAEADGAFTDDGLKAYVKAMVKAQCGQLDNSDPIVLMVHGFLYDPQTGGSNPHTFNYHFNRPDGDRISVDEARDHSVGWPTWLEFEEDDQGANGLVLGFGWFSFPRPLPNLKTWSKNFYAEACALADRAAPVLHAVMRAVVDAFPGRRIDIFAHSLGTWVVLGMMQAADAGLFKRFDRVLLLGGAAYRSQALPVAARLDQIADGPQVFNVMNLSDDVLEDFGRLLGPGGPGIKPVIGYDGLGKGFQRWMSYRLDRADVKTWGWRNGYGFMSELGTGALITDWGDHWVYYCADGNLRFLKDILRKRQTVAGLRDWGLPEAF